MDNKEYICEYCSKEFSRHDSLKRHYGTCKAKKNSKIDNKYKDLVEKINSIEKKYNLLEKINNELKNELNVIKKNNNNNIKNNNNNKNSNNINTSINSGNNNNVIIINTFGEDDMTRITKKQMENVCKRKLNAVPALLKLVNFNISFPENHNISFNNIKSIYGQIYDGDKFIIKKLDEILEDIKNKKKEEILEFLETKDYDLPKSVIDKVKEGLEALDYDPLEDSEEEIDKKKQHLKKMILEEMKLTIYNNRDIVAETHKKVKKNK